MAFTIFHGFVAPYEKATRSPFIFRPPQTPHFFDDQGFSLRPFVYGTAIERDVATMSRTFADDPSSRYYLQFLVRGDPYLFLGLVPTDVHLFGVESGGTLFLMGTDDLGRDVFSRVISGAKYSLIVSTIILTIAVTVGTIIGAIAGFFGGIVDTILMRITELLLSLPQLPLLLMVIYLFRDKLRQSIGVETGTFLLMVLAIGGLRWMPVARLVRASFLSLKEKEFMEAARCLGVPTHRMILVHLLPNALSQVIVAASLAIGAAILAESTLSFLGLGFPPDYPTWGRLLFDAKDLLDTAPHVALIPGAMIFLTVLSINFIGDGLRDALDPRRAR